MSSNFFTFVDLGSLMIGVIVIAVLIFCVSLSVDETPGLSGFLKRTEKASEEKRQRPNT